MRPLLHLIIGTILALTALGAAAAGSVIDQMGRSVVVPNDPRRVVALAPSITEIVYALGREDRLVGVTRFSNYPPAAKDLPRVGSYVHLDLERIVALAPDLCIAVKDGNPKAVIDRLEALQIPVYAVNPVDLTSIGETILEVGGLLDARQAAESVVAAMNARITAVKNQVAGTTHRPRVFFQIGISPIVSVGSGTFIHELITMAGGINVAAGEAPYPRFSREETFALSPEILIITSMDRNESFLAAQAEWQRWPEIPAARDNRIHLVDSDLFDRASPRLVDGLELLAGLLHPELAQAAP
ncbi:MAG TPA: cobalamin-binding protein [Desulfobacterales bacterium]|jgi:iron complex transport system substrate-binding protein|nr:cobalamin-binding protein [Desulfobacterales bacterium]